MFTLFDFDKRIYNIDKDALALCKNAFSTVEETASYNSAKVLKAFIGNGVSDIHFGISTGYGYGDVGREVLEKVFSDIVGAESSLIRHNFMSGTHTLSVGLFGLLRPGDTMLSVVGRPYDTLIGVLGLDGKTNGSLKEFGVNYDEVPLNENIPDYAEIERKINEKYYKMVYIQRSRGYSLRKSLTVADIEKIVKIVRTNSPDSIIFVDNCYGEFTEKKEPTDVGADIIAGSLIKNPGGGIARTGGYIAGKKRYVDMCAERLTCPGVGGEIGATLGMNRELFLGLFFAPEVVSQALKTAIYTAAVFSSLGYSVYPGVDEKRGDIVEAIKLGDRNSLISFCKGIQSGSPVDAHLSPEPWAMPGYDSDVIMAAGTFTGGASIELSADAPLREPFAVWMQGGLNFNTAKIGVLSAVNNMIKDEIL